LGHGRVLVLAAAGAGCDGRGDGSVGVGTAHWRVDARRSGQITAVGAADLIDLVPHGIEERIGDAAGDSHIADLGDRHAHGSHGNIGDVEGADHAAGVQCAGGQCLVRATGVADVAQSVPDAGRVSRAVRLGVTDIATAAADIIHRIPHAASANVCTTAAILCGCQRTAGLLTLQAVVIPLAKGRYGTAAGIGGVQGAGGLAQRLCGIPQAAWVLHAGVGIGVRNRAALEARCRGDKPHRRGRGIPLAQHIQRAACLSRQLPAIRVTRLRHVVPLAVAILCAGAVLLVAVLADLQAGCGVSVPAAHGVLFAGGFVHVEAA